MKNPSSGTMTAQNTLELEILEALLLLERKRFRLYTEDQATITFEDLLSITAGKDERIWTKYLIYRDLRQRGYVVRMGFGNGIDFRVFPRGVLSQKMLLNISSAFWLKVIRFN